MIPVVSSAVKAVGYDPVARRMNIRFKQNAKTYTFCRVPAHIFEGLLAASSKGRYYDHRIRGRYPC